MAILKGNNQHNNLVGSIADDVIYGYGGDDVLIGDAGDDVLKGASGADILIGGDGNDVLNGGEGVDILIGGAGNDLYVVDSQDDAITELADAGVDIVRSSVTWELGGHLENLILTGLGAIDGTGNALANKLKGNGSDNLLGGGEGDDVLNGGEGFDTLFGGAGNDTLKVGDLNGDLIDGGEGIDNFQVDADDQWLDLRNAPNLSGIETIRLADSHSTLVVDAASVIALSDTDTLKVDASDGSNTLKMDSGWTDAGLVDGYHVFTKSSAILQVNPAITDIQGPESYTISNAATAMQVSDVFDSGFQEITLDFGRMCYRDWGLSSIDLSGFGLEDKLIISQHDGILAGPADYNTGATTRSKYIFEHYTSTASDYNMSFYTTTFFSYSDRVSWQQGATNAKLISHFRSSEKIYFHSGSIVFTFSGGIRQSSGKVELTGLPVGLPDSQFVFV